MARNVPLPQSADTASGAGMQVTGDLTSRVGQIIEMIRPAVQRDGGDIELVGVSEGGDVKIRLHGACVGCPSSLMTLKMGVERNLKDNVPEVRSVTAID